MSSQYPNLYFLLLSSDFDLVTRTSPSVFIIWHMTATPSMICMSVAGEYLLDGIPCYRQPFPCHIVLVITSIHGLLARVWGVSSSFRTDNSGPCLLFQIYLKVSSSSRYELAYCKAGASCMLIYFFFLVRLHGYQCICFWWYLGIKNQERYAWIPFFVSAWPHWAV